MRKYSIMSGAVNPTPRVEGPDTLIEALRVARTTQPSCDCGTESCGGGASRCNPPAKGRAVPGEAECDGALLVGGDSFDVIVSDTNIHSNMSKSEWKSLQDRLSSLDFADVISFSGVGTGGVQAVPISIPAGQCYFLGVYVMLSYAAVGSKPAVSVSLDFTDDQGVARTGPAILGKARKWDSEFSVLCGYELNTRMVTTLGRLNSVGPVGATVNFNAIPSSCDYTIVVLTSSSLAQLRGQQ